MSVELHQQVTGECDCSVPKDPYAIMSDHRHDVVCDWGVIEHPNPRPDRGEVGALMLMAIRFFESLRIDGPIITSWRGMYSAEYAAGGARRFVHLAYGDRTWVWELHDAHPAWDAAGTPILIGRWPD